MAKKHVKTEFDGLYQGVEEHEEGVGVAYTRKGHYSVFIRMDNPVVQYSANINEYYEAAALFENIIKSLGDGYSLQKQDIFSRQTFDPEIAPDAKFLNRAYMNFFRGENIRRYRHVLSLLKKLSRLLSVCMTASGKRISGTRYRKSVTSFHKRKSTTT